MRNKRRSWKPLESDIQLQILKYLGIVGANGGKTKTMGVKRGNSYWADPYLFLGFPDVTFFFRGNLYFCEVKRPGGRQSPAQIEFQARCKNCGIRYILAYSVDDVIEYLKKDGYNV